MSCRLRGNLTRPSPASVRPSKSIRNYVDAYIDLGYALSSQKKLDDAIACYRKAVEIDSKSVVAWQQMGWAEYRVGNWRASIEALETSCKLREARAITPSGS